MDEKNKTINGKLDKESLKELCQGKTLDIYIDGGCRQHNNNLGGWSLVVVLDEQIVAEDSGARYKTTDPCMKLTAAAKALQLAEEIAPTSLKVITDSTYVADSAEKRLDDWLTPEGFVSPDRKYADLWQCILDIRRRVSFPIKFEWVRSHAGNRWNDYSGKLASRAMDSISKKQSRGFQIAEIS